MNWQTVIGLALVIGGIAAWYKGDELVTWIQSMGKRDGEG